MTSGGAATILAIVGVVMLFFSLDVWDDVAALILRVLGTVFTLPALIMLWGAVLFG